MREEDALASIEALGLTPKESRAYLHLIRNGVSTAREVSEALGVQYPAVYRILQALQVKGWVEAGRERPNRYRARNPKVVAEETRRIRSEIVSTAALAVAGLEDQMNTKARGTDADLFLYKGVEGVAKKLREVVLAADDRVLVVAPFPVDPEVLRLLFTALRDASRPARVVLNAGNGADVGKLRGVLPAGTRVETKFPAARLPETRLAHSFVFPSDHELFIVNSFYRGGALVAEKLQGLWIGDADYVRLQLEAMVKGLETARNRPRRAFPSG